MIHDSRGLFADFDLWGYMSVIIALILMVVLVAFLIGIWEELIERIIITHRTGGKMGEYGRRKGDFQCKLDRGRTRRQERDYQVKLPRNLSEQDKKDLMCECVPGTICSLKVEHWLQSKCRRDRVFPNKVRRFDGTLESTALNKGKAYEIHKKLRGE